MEIPTIAGMPEMAIEIIIVPTTRIKKTPGALDLGLLLAENHLRLKLLIFDLERLYLFSGIRGLFLGALTAEQSNQVVGLGFDALLQRSFDLQQRRVYAVPNLGPGLGERLDQHAGARPFAGLKRGDGMAL